MPARHSGHDLTSGPVGAHLRRQAIPFSIGLLAIFSFEAIDLFFIAQLGNDPLAAVSFALPVIWLVYGIGIGFEAGAASCVSRAVGGRDDERARRLTTDTIVLGTLAALAMTGIGLATIEPVFSLLGAPPELLPIIRDYMHVWYWVAPLDLALWTMLASIRARGNSLLESKIITVAALLNLVLDPIFIFGLFGFPRLEVAGAALATLVATAIMLAFSTWHLGVRLGVFATTGGAVAGHLGFLDAHAADRHSGDVHQCHHPGFKRHRGGHAGRYRGGCGGRLWHRGAHRTDGADPVLCPVGGVQPLFRPEFRRRAFRPPAGGAADCVTRFCLLFGLCLALVTSLAAPLIAGCLHRFSRHPRDHPAVYLDGGLELGRPRHRDVGKRFV